MRAALDCTWVPIGNGRLTVWHRLGRGAAEALRAFGCEYVVTLLSEREGAPTIGTAVAEAGMEWVWLPLENGRPPHGAPAEAILATLPGLAARLAAGRSIVIHCSAGIHRTGMVAYSLLRHCGHEEEDALGLLRRMRAHTGNGVQRKQIDWGNASVPLGPRLEPLSGTIGTVTSPATD